MKYSIEYKDGKFIETVEVDNNKATKVWERKEGEFLKSEDEDFAEQFKEVLDEDICDAIGIEFDESTLVADIEDFVMLNDVE